MEHKPGGNVDSAYLDRLEEIREAREREHEARSRLTWALTPEEKARREARDRLMERQPMVELCDRLSKLPTTVAEYLRSKGVAPDAAECRTESGGEKIPVWFISKQTSEGYVEYGSGYSYSFTAGSTIGGEALATDGTEYTMSGSPEEPHLTPTTPHYGKVLQRWVGSGRLAYYEWKNDTDITEKRNWREFVADNYDQLTEEFESFIVNSSDEELREYCEAIYESAQKYYTDFAERRV